MKPTLATTTKIFPSSATPERMNKARDAYERNGGFNDAIDAFDALIELLTTEENGGLRCLIEPHVDALKAFKDAIDPVLFEERPKNEEAE